MAADKTTTYTYPTAGAAHPHAVQTATTAGVTTNYGYDDSGNTTTGPYAAAGGSTTLTYDAEGNPVSSKDANGTTTYLYDPDGALLLTRAPDKTTLDLGSTQLNLASGAATATTIRNYSYAGSTIATRTAAGLTWVFGDNHGTGDLAINATNGTTSRRWYTPFGETRAPASGDRWPNNHDYVNGTTNTSTSLIHLGARDYDASTGRFTTPDPVLDPKNPQQLNGYAYANNSPVTSSDPTGLLPYMDGPYCIYQCGSYGTDGGNSRNDNHGGKGHWHRMPSPEPKKTPIVHLSPHVLIHAGDPMYPQLQADWNKYSQEYPQFDEWNTWAWICEFTKDCRGELMGYFDNTAGGNEVGFQAFMDAKSILVGSIGAAANGIMFIRKLNDPQSMRGATAEEVDAMAKDAGLKAMPLDPKYATGGRGMRYFDPENKKVTLMTEEGDPTWDDETHQGPYLKYQVQGAGRKGAIRVPLEGKSQP